jgi:putative peptidoglycan lipid II flippase
MSGQVFGFVLLSCIGITILGLIAAPLIIKLAQFVGMGNVAPEIYQLTVNLTRMIFPIIIFIALSGLAQGIQNSLGNFQTPAIATFFFNIVIIFMLLAEDSLTTNARIQVAAIAFVVGALAQLLYQMPRFRRDGIPISLRINLKDPVYGRMAVLAPAAMLGYATMVINSFVDKSIAYSLPDTASLSALTYGFRVEQLPFSVFGVSVATALFPTISRYLTEKRMDDFKRTTEAGVRVLIFTVVPAMVIFLALKRPIIQIIFERGAFGIEATTSSADSLFMYTLGIVPASLMLLIARVFFARQDMKTPLYAGIVSVFLNFILDIYFAQPWGLGMGFKGIALCTSIVAFVNLGILVFILDRRYGGFINMHLNRHVGKIIIAGFWQYVSAQYFYAVARKYLFHTPMTETAEFMPVFISFLIAVAFSLVIFISLLIVMRAGELKMIKDLLFKRARGNKTGEGDTI